MHEFLSVLRNRNMGLLLSGQLVSAIGDWLYMVAVSIAIYDYSGGKSFYIGLLWIVRFIPPLVLGTFSGALADRLGHRRAMIIADIGRILIIGALGFTLNGHTWVVLYPLAFLNSALGGLFHPASVGFIPAVVEAPEQRMTANASLMQTEALAGIIGGGLGGAIAGGGHITAALLIDSATFAVSAMSLALIRLHPIEIEGDAAEGDDEEDPAGKGFLSNLRYLARRPVLIFTATVMILPEFAYGALIVWMVPYGERTLGLGQAGVGYLYALLTAGAVVGGFVASYLGSNMRLDRLLALSVGAGGIALAAFGVANVAAFALACALLMGLTETVESVAYETLLQQAVPESVIARAAGTIDSLLFGAVMAGTAVSGILASTIGLRPSIFGMGLLVMLAGVGAWIQLRIRTAGQPDAGSLARIPAFASVPLEVREWAVRRMVRETMPAGAVIIHQGERGDTFYTIARGDVQVQISENGRSMTKNLGPGDFFGEIALLRNVPRTATVTAIRPVTLWEMSREDFEELQKRAGQFKDTLWEAAAARLQESTDFKMALATRP